MRANGPDPVTAPTEGPAALSPESRFWLCLSQGAAVTDLWRRGLPIHVDETHRLRDEFRRGVSDLGPDRARQVLREVAAAWASANNTCLFCAAPAHPDGPMTCPTLPTTQEANDA